MIRVSVTELRNQLSKYLRLTKQGETVEVLERGIPVARIEGIAEPAAAEDGLRERLVRAGVLSPARRKPDPEILQVPPIACSADPARVIAEERGDR